MVESVSVQDIRYADSITDAYAAAQSAQVEQTAAANRQETARIEAKTKSIEAQGTADSNRILAESLTDKVLTSQYIEALKEAASNNNLIITDSSSQLMLNTNNQ